MHIILMWKLLKVWLILIAHTLLASAAVQLELQHLFETAWLDSRGQVVSILASLFDCLTPP